MFAFKTKFCQKELLVLVNEFSKDAGYKVNIQNSVVVLHTNKEQSGKKMRKTEM